MGRPGEGNSPGLCHHPPVKGDDVIQASESRACVRCGECFPVRSTSRRPQLYCGRRCVERASEERRSERPGGPACKCGCGMPVAWRSNRQQWYVYVSGHYRQAAAYKDEAWLRRSYADGWTTWEIAEECRVNHSTILKFMRKYGIERRNRSESRRDRHLAEANSAWKGGVAQWPYSRNWQELAQQIRDRDQWTCQDCGECRQRWGAALHVHHIDENKLNDDPANLVSLCARCHMVRHGALKEVMPL